MTNMVTVNARLSWFEREMQKKMSLPENRKKSDWREDTLGDIFRALDVEVKELATALDSGAPEKAIIEECADVANFAFMLADLARFQVQEKVREQLRNRGKNPPGPSIKSVHAQPAEPAAAPAPAAGKPKKPKKSVEIP